jgi:hypothetical protein
MVYLLGCKVSHPRPTGVPPSAVRVDNTFVDCSIEPRSDANRCTVYKDDTGEILAEGLFVLNTSHLAAEKSDLRYAAFGKQGIILHDLRILEQRTASQRDPSHRIIDERLKILASKGGLEPLDCRNANAVGATDASAECALKAFAVRRPFYLRYYLQYPNSFGYKGFAGDSEGNVYLVEYYSDHEFEYGDTVGVYSDGEHMSHSECPKPTGLSKAKDGTLFCVIPAVKHPYIIQSSPN